MRRTAVRYSLFASLELRGLVTGITSLREILSKFPLPHVLIDDDQCFVCRTTYSLLADGRVDPTARVEAQGPIGILQSVLGHTIADKQRPTTCASRSTTFLDRPCTIYKRQPTTEEVFVNTVNDNDSLETHLDSFSTTHQRRITSHALSCDTSKLIVDFDNAIISAKTSWLELLGKAS